MPGLAPGIHADPLREPSGGCRNLSAWMAGTSPALTAGQRPLPRPLLRQPDPGQRQRQRQRVIEVELLAEQQHGE